MDFSRLQAAFSDAIPATATANSIEVAKLQEQISKWREGAKAQIEAESDAEMRRWKERIHSQLSTEGKMAAIKAIEKERKTAKFKLIHDAHERGVLLPHEEIEGVLEAADLDEEEEEEEDGIDGPSLSLTLNDLGQGSVASLESGISAITADTANIVGGKKKGQVDSGAAKSGDRARSPQAKTRASTKSAHQAAAAVATAVPASASLPQTSVQSSLRAEALKAYKKLEAKYTSTASPGTGGDAEEDY